MLSPFLSLILFLQLGVLVLFYFAGKLLWILESSFQMTILFMLSLYLICTINCGNLLVFMPPANSKNHIFFVSLKQIGGSCDVPWLITGDFNYFISQFETLGGRSTASSSYSGF